MKPKGDRNVSITKTVVMVKIKKSFSPEIQRCWTEKDAAELI